MTKIALKAAGARWGSAQLIQPVSSTLASRWNLPPGVTRRETVRIEKPAGEACLACPLLRRRCVPTEFSPPGRRLLTIIGEAPGRMELEDGRPFCFVPETLVLMADLTWRQLGDVKVGDRIWTIEEEPRIVSYGVSKRKPRVWTCATVTQTHRRLAPTIRIATADGELIGTGDHRVLAGGISRGHVVNVGWREMQRLAMGKQRTAHIMFVSRPWAQRDDFTAGWVGGFLDGEGHVLGSHSGRRRRGGTVGFSQNQGSTEQRAVRLIKDLGFAFRAKHEQRTKGVVCVRHELAGGPVRAMQLLGITRAERLIADFERVVSGQKEIRNLTASKLLQREKSGLREVVDITTTAGTFIANGFVVHNCGPSGRFLEQQLKRIGIRRDEVTWTNAALCEAKTETETKEASRHCAARLQREIADSAIIVPVGAYALSSTMRSKKRLKITKWRGFVIRDVDVSDLTRPTARLILPTVHPAFVLRSDIWGPVIQTDFERIKRVLEGGWSSPFADPGHHVLVPQDFGQLRTALTALAQRIGKHGAVSIDVETPMDTRATQALLVCFALSDGRLTVAVPWFKGGENKWRPHFGSEQPKAAALVTAFLKHAVAITHNGATFDHLVLERHGISVADWDDTLYAHHAFAGHMPQSLAHVVSMYLDAPPWKEKKHRSYAGLLRYNAHDAQFTALAWQAMQPELAAERVPYERTRKAALLCQKLQVNGMRFDRKRARRLSRFLKKRIYHLKYRATKLLGKEINLNSHVQLRKVYFEELEAPVFFHTKKTGAPSLSIDAIRAYMTYQDPKLRELSRILVDYRSANITRSNFIKNIKTDGRSRVHSSWRPTQVGGRFASSAPNMLNLTAAHRDPTIELGGVRSLYCAPKGRVLVHFDAKQIEMRVAAYLSGDQVMIDACESADIHAATSSIIFKEAFNAEEYAALKKLKVRTPEQEKRFTVLDKLRDLSKRSGFAVIYGAEAPTVHLKIVADGIDISEPQVAKMLFELKNSFVVYYRFQDDLLHQTIRLGYVESPFLKRKRWVGHAPKPNEVMNFPIQAGAAEHVISVLLALDAALDPDDLLVNYGYDAATYEVAEQRADAVVKVIKEVAESPVTLAGRRVVFPVDTKVGQRWSELK